jgi:hypothetical protein
VKRKDVTSKFAARTKPTSRSKLRNTETASNHFWPDGIRLVVSIFMQFEAGGQPLKGTDSPLPPVGFPDNVPSDAAANTWFAMAIV